LYEVTTDNNNTLTIDTNNLQFPLTNKKFWQELATYFPFMQHGLHGKGRLEEIFFAAGTFLSSHHLAQIGQTHRLSFDASRIA
jgi:hypothetical protein